MVTDDFDKVEVLKIAGIVEKVSDHPLAKAVVIEFEGHFGNNCGEAKYEVKEFQNHSGMGVTANISADRDYNGADEMRERAEKSLECAMDMGLSFTITDLVEHGRPVHPDTVDAYNDIKLQE